MNMDRPDKLENQEYSSGFVPNNEFALFSRV